MEFDPNKFKMDNVVDLGQLGKPIHQVQVMRCPHPECDVQLPLEFPPDVNGLMGMMASQMHMIGHVLNILASAQIRAREVQPPAPVVSRQQRRSSARKAGK